MNDAYTFVYKRPRSGKLIIHIVYADDLKAALFSAPAQLDSGHILYGLASITTISPLSRIQ